MFWWLVETTLITAALAAVVALVCHGLRPRPAVRHALWLIVLVKLVTPPLIRWPWPLPDFLSEQAAPPCSSKTVVEVSPAFPLPPSGGAVAVPLWEPLPPREVFPVLPEVAQTVELSEPVEAPVSVVLVPEAPAPGADWREPLVRFWLVGVAVMAMLQLVRTVRFRLRVARGTPAPGALVAAVDDLARRLGVRAPPIRVLPDLHSPVVWGVGRPMLLWPASLLGQLPSESERAAIVHELAHLRRRDHWVGWLQLIAGCLWWWNPLARYCCRQVAQAAELACDAWVVETLPQARRAYAQALLAVCELMSQKTAPALAVGMAGARQELERRLIMIMRESMPCRVPVRGLLVAGLLAMIALPGWSLGQRASSTGSADEPPATAQPKPTPPPAVAENLRVTVTAVDAIPTEQRLQKLEAALQELLKEVKEMRAASGKTPATATTPAPKPSDKPGTGGGGYTLRFDTKPLYSQAVAAFVRTEGQPIHLTRATYKLPRARAEALAAFLKENVKTPVVETKVEGDTLVVTASPGAQQTIHHLIDLMQGKEPSGGYWYFGQSVPYTQPMRSDPNTKPSK